MKKSLLCLATLISLCRHPAYATDLVTRFTTSAVPAQQSRHVNYNVNMQTENYYVWVPNNFSKSETYGLIVYVSSAESSGMPTAWQSVLERRKFLLVCPQNAGNSVPSARRTGLAIMGAMQMTRSYRIDPNRIYAAGISGGARTASAMAFWQPDLFRGTIQDCGSDYVRPVQVTYATGDTDTNGRHYGLLESTTLADAAAARAQCKFVLITGANDFRRGNILDIYNNGFKPDGFKVKLIDVPTMGHEDCDARTLEEALDFLK